MEPHKFLQIAIDGPVGSGKSDISTRLAKKIGLTYLYTGAMYRALALACLRQRIKPKDTARVLPLLTKYKIDLVPPDRKAKRAFKVLLNGKDVTEKLFTPAVDLATSDISTLPEVRRFMVAHQQTLAKGKAVVMEGRDIGYRVLPSAQLKIFLTADARVRARRRFAQYKTKGIKKTFEEVYKDTVKRDDQDKHRTTDPLKKLPDAWRLNTSGMNQNQVISAIVDELRKRALL